MTVRVFSDSDSQWDEVVQRMGIHDPYFSRSWHSASARPLDGGQAELFTYEESGALFAIGAIRRPVPGVPGVSDLETPHGYGGPFATTDDAGFIERAWIERDDWARSKCTVAEFRRFHPLLQNHELAEQQCIVKFDRPTVVIEIAEAEADQIATYKSNARRNVRKSLRQGVMVEEAVGAGNLDVFVALYGRTMDRLGASSFYRFPRSYFDELAEMPETRLFAATLDNQVLAMALVMVGHKILHYHLGANDERFFELRPMNALLHGVTRWGAARGFKEFHLGGGRSSAQDDALLRFKASMSSLRKDYFIGTRLFQHDLYGELRENVYARTGNSRALTHALPWRLA